MKKQLFSTLCGKPGVFIWKMEWKADNCSVSSYEGIE